MDGSSSSCDDSVRGEVRSGHPLREASRPLALVAAQAGWAILPTSSLPPPTTKTLVGP